MQKFIVFIIFFISACSNSTPRFYPEGHNLSEGFVGQNYFSLIEISNAVLFKENIGVDIVPMGTGLKWQPKMMTSESGGTEEDYHYIIITGKPNKSGDILIHINGYSMGTAIAGSKIDKKYIIKVN